jgi:hypothetical protein
VLTNIEREHSLALIEELCETMLRGSLCGLGGCMPFPVQSALKHFREDFHPDDRDKDAASGARHVRAVPTQERKPSPCWLKIPGWVKIPGWLKIKGTQDECIGR